MEAGLDASVVASGAARLDSLLQRLQTGGAERGPAQVAFWGALLIVLREGLEAALLVAALLAALRRAGRAAQGRAVHLGWALALLLGVVAWWASGRLFEDGGPSRVRVEGTIQLATAAFLFYASHGLLARERGRRWIAFLSERAASHASAASALGLAFLAGFREVFEAGVLLRGLLVETGDRLALVGAGAAVAGGLLLAAVLGFQRAGHRLPVGPLLSGSGLLLSLLSVVMTGQGLRALQEAGVLHLTPLPFDSIEVVGLYNSVEGLLAQAALLLTLLLSFAGRGWFGGAKGKPVAEREAPGPAAG
jgi:high-affinity iron transporter